MEHYLEPPATAQDLDVLIHRIDAGEGTFASLSDEQRDQLKIELSEEWIAGYLDKYPVPEALAAATLEYRAIESGQQYPNLPENIRNDILLEFNERHGEGGPEGWSYTAPST